MSASVTNQRLGLFAAACRSNHWIGLGVRQTSPSVWVSVWLPPSAGENSLRRSNWAVSQRRKEGDGDDARENCKRGSTIDTRSLSLDHLSHFALSPFSTLSHSHDRTQNPSPRPSPRPRNQDRTASAGRYQDRTGQGRQGQAIVTTRHRPTPTLPRRNTVSQSCIYRLSHEPSQLV